METLAQVASLPISVETVLSVFSATVTAYFWFVKSKEEKPRLSVFQLHDFRASLRRGSPENQTRRLGLTQILPGGVLVTNHSIRQNSIVRFDCQLKDQGRWIKGRGFVEDDKPPWNIAPQSSIAMSLACYFDVPEDFEIPEDLSFRIEFITASGKRFNHVFPKRTPDE